MSEWSAELARLEEMLLKVHAEQRRLVRRVMQLEQAVLELRHPVTTGGQDSLAASASPRKGKGSSAK